MRIVIAILSLALLMWAEAAGAQSAGRTYSVSVSVHKDLMRLQPLTEDDVKVILDKASKMLQKSPGHHDTDDNVACNVTFTLKGPIRTFPSGDTSPDIPAEVDQAHIDDVHRVDSNVDGADFHVKVVRKIREFCRFPDKPNGQGFSGCSFPPNFHSIIVVHPATHLDRHSPDQKHPRDLSKGAFPDHVLWAHEFGHLTGLGHEGDQELAQNSLMTPCPLDAQFSADARGQVHVSKHQCDCLRSGPEFGPNGTCSMPGPNPGVTCKQ